METPNPKPNATNPQPSAGVGTAPSPVGQTAWRAAWPLLAVGGASFLIYRVSALLLLVAGAAALGRLLWRVSRVVLSAYGPVWLPEAVAGGFWLLYAMRSVFGWREEMGYWASLWHVFGWNFITTLVVGALVIAAIPLAVKTMDNAS